MDVFKSKIVHLGVKGKFTLHCEGTIKVVFDTTQAGSVVVQDDQEDASDGEDDALIDDYHF